jgi:hypothetical protein
MIHTLTKHLIVLLILMGSVLSAQDAVLPGDHFSVGWQKSEKLRRFTRYNLYNHINGGAELFLEFGFESLLMQRYMKEDQELTLELYRMETPESALGIYLMKCGQETPVPGISARNSGNRFQFTVLKGQYYIQIYNADGEETVLPDMIALTTRALDPIPEEKPVSLFELLPKEHLISGSERIFRGPNALEPIFTFGQGDIFQLKGEVFGVLGDYSGKHQNSHTLILIPYPSEETAGSAYNHLCAHLDSYITVVKQEEQAFVFQDYQNQYGKVLHKESMISIRIHLKEEPAL